MSIGLGEFGGDVSCRMISLILSYTDGQHDARPNPKKIRCGHLCLDRDLSRDLNANYRDHVEACIRLDRDCSAGHRRFRLVWELL